MFPALKKILLLVLLVIFFITPTTTFAQEGEEESPTEETPSEQSQPTPRPPEKPSAENWDAYNQTTFFINSVVNTISCFGTGRPFGGKGCPNQVVDQNGQFSTLITYNGEGGGALGVSANMMAMMYDNRPASSKEYVAQMINNIGPKSAYAQVPGSGNGVIAPIYQLWEFTRNLAYMGFVVIFIVIGFMIMFRRKLNQQSVASVQVALPGLIVSLILVTFSYFIAALIIDLGFVLSQMFGVIFYTRFANPATIPGGDIPLFVQQLLGSNNVVALFWSLFNTPELRQTTDQIGTFTGNLINTNVNQQIIVYISVIATCLSPVGDLISRVANVVPGFGGFIGIAGCVAAGGLITPNNIPFIVSTLLFAILFLGFAQAMFRLLFSLINAYVMIIIGTILGPFYILVSALPGQGKQFTAWWKPLLANVLVFPAVFTALVLVASILGLSTAPWFLDPNALQVGNFNQTPPLLGGAPFNFVRFILAYGILLAVPGIPDYVRRSLGATQDQIFSAAINQTFGAGRQLLQGSFGAAGTILGRI